MYAPQCPLVNWSSTFWHTIDKLWAADHIIGTIPNVYSRHCKICIEVRWNEGNTPSNYFVLALTTNDLENLCFQGHNKAETVSIFLVSGDSLNINVPFSCWDKDSHSKSKTVSHDRLIFILRREPDTSQLPEPRWLQICRGWFRERFLHENIWILENCYYMRSHWW